MSSIDNEANKRAAGGRRRPALIAMMALSGGLLLMPAGSASAGAKSSAVVHISTSARTATGSVANTRAYSSWFDRDSYIGCWTSYDFATNTHTAGCDAKRGFTEIKCTAADEVQAYDFMWAMGLMGPTSYIEFTWDANMNCLTLKVYDDSRYAPKAP